MSDLLSLRIALKLAPNQDLDNRPIPKWWGEATHKLAVTVIASRDEALARELETRAGLKPFTVSNLRGRFPGGKIDPALPYPMPETVFGSLLDHWNAAPTVPVKLPEEARRYAKECMQLGRFDLHSRVLKMYGETLRGFVGGVRFHTTNYDRYWMGIMTMLAQYATYAGVGAKTTMGLGQCALLPERVTPNET